MTKEELAKELDGREYPMRLTQLSAQAMVARLVIVTGASDDIMDFNGAILDEVEANGGGTAYVTKAGLLPNHDEDCECPFCGYKAALATAHKIEAVWCPLGIECSWDIRTDIPHAKFNEMEDGEVFCRGIVFSLDDLGVVA